MNFLMIRSVDILISILQPVLSSLAFSLFCLTLGANQNAPDFDCDTLGKEDMLRGSSQSFLSLDTIALKSAEFCDHNVKDGFTWEEMRACEKKVENACKGRENCPGFKLPNEADFKRIDRKGLLVSRSPVRTVCI